MRDLTELLNQTPPTNPHLLRGIQALDATVDFTGEETATIRLPLKGVGSKLLTALIVNAVLDPDNRELRVAFEPGAADEPALDEYAGDCIQRLRDVILGSEVPKEETEACGITEALEHLDKQVEYRGQQVSKGEEVARTILNEKGSMVVSVLRREMVSRGIPTRFANDGIDLLARRGEISINPNTYLVTPKGKP